MAKAVLVMDMPEGCFDCKLGYFGLSGTDYCLMYRGNRKVENIDIHTERPDWCPLVEMPKRKHVNWTINIDGKQEPIKDEKAEGWDACLDALEGKS